MEKLFVLNWSPETSRAWGTSMSERIVFRGSLFECMERADSQCEDVTFRMEWRSGILMRYEVLIKGTRSGEINPE